MSLAKEIFKQYGRAWQHYAWFNGRASRCEFWTFRLINIALLFGFGFLLQYYTLTPEGTLQNFNQYFNPSISPYITGFVLYCWGCYYFFCLFQIIPTISISFRRLHDTGRSGWYLLLLFIPLLGPIILFIIDLLDSEKEANRYGLNPKSLDLNC